jgi:hypothetical protein
MLRKCWEESNTNSSRTLSKNKNKNCGGSGGGGKKKKRSTAVALYSKYEEYKTLVLQVLSRDIRSVTQRVKVPARERNADSGTLPALLFSSTSSGAAGGAGRGDSSTKVEEEEGKWHVELDGVDITYEVVLNQAGEKRVIVKSASI